MKIKIINVFTTESVYVEFVTASGKGKGVWNGSTPEVGNTYYVEIDIEGELIWDKDICFVNSIQDAISFIDDTNIILGKIVSIESDGCATIELNDSLILVETNCNIPISNRYVRILTSKLSIYEIPMA